jgi:hypothetical protein
MGLGSFFANFSEKVKSLFSSLGDFSSIGEAIKSHFKVVIIIAGAFLVIIALLLVLAIVSHPGIRSKPADGAGYSMDTGSTPLREPLPAEDFFLPYEPDFVPDVLLERDPKDGWTEEDARPFWTDPLEGNEEFWRKRIESGIDSLLEHVP